MTGFGTEVEELIRVYRASLLLPNPGAVDYGRDVVSQGKGGHGTHGERGRIATFGQDVPFCVAMETALARFVEVWEARLRREVSGVPGHAPKGDKVGSAKRAEDRAVLACVGQDPTEVAYLYGRTTEGVRKLRQRNGLDADTGERARRDVLTAPARTTLQAHESATPTTTPEDPA